MKRDFLIEDEPAKLFSFQHKFFVRMSREYEMRQIRQDFTYLKYAGFFIFASIAFMLMREKGIVSNYLIGIVFIGFGVLVAMILSMIFISADIDRKLAYFRKKETLNSKTFHIPTLEANSSRKISMIFRFLPFGFVGICTILAGLDLWINIFGRS